MPEHPDLDQLASAWLDGALEDEERALLAADPALAAQVEARAAPMRNLSAWLAVPSPDPARREADIALAVAELGQARSRPPTGLARRPALPRARRQRRTGAVLAWAAVIVALLFGGGVLASINLSGDDDDTGVAAPPVEFDAEDIERAGQSDGGAREGTIAAAGEAADDALATMAAPGRPDLGRVASTEDLHAALDQADERAHGPTGGAEAGAEGPCASELEALARERGAPETVATLTWQDEPAVAARFGDRDVVLSTETCTVLADVVRP